MATRPHLAGVRRLPILWLYVAAVSVAGLGLLLLLLVGTVGLGDINRAPQTFWLLAVFVVVGELFPIKVPRGEEEEEITTSTTFVFAIQISIGTVPAVVAQAVSSLIADLMGRKPLWKAGFNVAQTTLSLVAAGAVLTQLTHAPRVGPMHFAPGDLPGILAAAAVYFVVNNALMAVALAFAQSVPILRYLLDDLPFQALAAGVLLSLSPAVVVAGDFSPLLIPLLALPLLAVHRSASASLENARLVSELEESLTRLADQAAENEYLAFHDALTSLPNRILFHDRVEAATRLAQREGGVAAVMIMDLDHFKEINDTLGHDHGDTLLRQLGTRLRSVLRKSDTLARMGGDEFGILLPSVSGRDGAVRVADKVRRALEEPFDVDGMALEVSGTIGISLFPEHGGNVDKLIQRADVAMYWGKAAHTGYEFYDPRKDRYSPSRLSLVARLRQALEARELILHYQPKVELRTGEIRGVEALVRWRHPKRGLVPPGEFLPLTERTGLIGPLTSYVLNAALGKCRALRLAGFEMAVAVNLSARNLSDAELPDVIAGLLARWRLPASALEVEITETSIMADPGQAIDVLGRLRTLGVVVSLDDFGTGYSSLAFLRQLPIDEIKIDRSFVGNMVEEEDDAVIVRSTIDLGRNLGLRVVAEGVETEEAWDRLKELRCDLAQGYFIGEPIPSEDLARWLENIRRRDRTIRPRLRLARLRSISQPARRQPPAAVS